MVPSHPSDGPVGPWAGRPAPGCERRQVALGLLALPLAAWGQPSNGAATTASAFMSDLAGSAWRVRVEGDIRTRTLRIDDVQPADGGRAVLQADYGWSDIGQSAVAAALESAAGRVTLRLTTQAHSALVAVRQGAEVFTGTFTPAGGKPRAARLERMPLERARMPAVTSTEVTLPGAGVRLGGVLYRPDLAEPGLPAVVLLHGWAERWVNGAGQVAQAACQMATAGYVALALSMRGWPPSGGVDDCGLEQPDDVAAAVEWLAQQPGVDGRRIAVIGYSQGGQVALSAAARSPRLRAVVANFPVIDIARWGRTSSHDGIRDFYVPGACQSGRARSPIDRAADILAPVLLVHGDADTRVPTEQSVLMHEALQRAGRMSQLRIVKGAAHGFDAAQRAELLPVTLDFLARQMHLRP